MRFARSTYATAAPGGELVCPLTPDQKYDPAEDASAMLNGAEGELRVSRDYHFYCFFEVPPEAVLVGNSEFPLPVEDGYHFFTDDELKKALYRQREIIQTDPQKYGGDTRGLICAVSMELNFRQRWAPRFRRLPTLTRSPTTDAERHYLVDLQVLDLHWRACSPFKPRGAVQGYEGIFRSRDWCVTAAVHFAERELPFNYKLVDARLTPSMTVEHAALQTEDIRDLWRVLRDGFVRGSKIEKWGAPQLEAKLMESMCGEPHLQRHVPGLVNTWIAYKLVGRREPAKIARLLGLMTGEKPLDRRAITNKLDALERRTGWTLD